MAKKDPRVDAYIAKAQPFAQPILKHIRAQFHKNCPEVEETLKWSMPSFMYKGILAGMAGFKQHCVLGFWKHKLVVGHDRNEDAMGSFGRITDVSQLPNDKNMALLIKKAMKLNDEGVKVARKPVSKVKAPLRPPTYFVAALKRNRKAKATYDTFSYSCKKEYLEWITEAKTEETRNRRLTQAIEWMAEGKQRNWKYANC
ncbi:MAG TPA: YdeI/OmpD-associated family protein [Terriglobales bacterium]|nr:YdeI/OmpD-associated family protein [Terriglobales bacterium]